MLLLLLICCSTTEKTPEEYNKQMKCISKKSGSQPECWDEKDWEIICSRVECKEKESTQLGGE